MRTTHYYDLNTGVFSGRYFKTDDAHAHDLAVQLNMPAGHGAVEGQFDPLCQRVDIATGEVVDWQPPAPSSDHEFDATTKRWQLSDAAQAKAAAHAAARQRIAALRDSQHDLVRRLLLGDESAREALQGIEDEIALHR